MAKAMTQDSNLRRGKPALKVIGGGLSLLLCVNCDAVHQRAEEIRAEKAAEQTVHPDTPLVAPKTKAAPEPACQVEVDAPASERTKAEKAARNWCNDLIAKVGLVYEPGESMAMRLYLSPAGERRWARSQRVMMGELEKSVRNLGEGNKQHYNFQYRDLTTGKRLGGCSREPRMGQGLECSVN